MKKFIPVFDISLGKKEKKYVNQCLEKSWVGQGKFVSIFEKHEHTLCSEQQVHVHESTVKCEICSFHFTSSNYNLVQQNELEGLSISEKKPERNGSLLHHSFAITNIQLRGPPVLS